MKGWAHTMSSLSMFPAGIVPGSPSSSLCSYMQLADRTFWYRDVDLYSRFFLWAGRLWSYGLEGLPEHYEASEKRKKEPMRGHLTNIFKEE